MTTIGTLKHQLIFCSQVLGLWRDQLDASFTIKQFVKEVKLWERKGFVEPGIWTDLKSYLQPHLLPTGIISSIPVYLYLQIFGNKNSSGHFTLKIL